MNTELTVIARIVPKQNHFEDAKAAILGIVDRTREESGCLTFVLCEGKGDDKAFYLYEVWRSDEDLASHHEQSYTKHVFSQYEAWLTQPVEVRKMTRIA